MRKHCLFNTHFLLLGLFLQLEKLVAGVHRATDSVLVRCPVLLAVLHARGILCDIVLAVRLQGFDQVAHDILDAVLDLSCQGVEACRDAGQGDAHGGELVARGCDFAEEVCVEGGRALFQSLFECFQHRFVRLDKLEEPSYLRGSCPMVRLNLTQFVPEVRLEREDLLLGSGRF